MKKSEIFEQAAKYMRQRADIGHYCGCCTAIGDAFFSFRFDVPAPAPNSNPYYEAMDFFKKHCRPKAYFIPYWFGDPCALNLETRLTKLREAAALAKKEEENGDED
jgi:hypothetical protein